MKINPVALGLPVKLGTDLKVRVVSFETDATSCTLYYEVLGEDKTRLAEGNINLTEQEFSEWGHSNDFLENIALSKLGLSRLNGIDEIDVYAEQIIEKKE